MSETIYLHYKNPSNNMLETARWAPGDDSLQEISSMTVVAITVFGSTLSWIRQNVTGIPMVSGVGEEENTEPMNCTNTDFSKPIPLPILVRSLVWHGDDAKFLAGVIPGLL